jgi:hypothetical protein
MSVRAPTVAFMDPSPIVSMDALWPELVGQRRPFEVVVTVPRDDGGLALRERPLRFGPPARLSGSDRTQTEQGLTDVAVVCPVLRGCLH